MNELTYEDTLQLLVCCVLTTGWLDEEDANSEEVASLKQLGNKLIRMRDALKEKKAA